jgi:hypothetical protein
LCGGSQAGDNGRVQDPETTDFVGNVHQELDGTGENRRGRAGGDGLADSGKCRFGSFTREVLLKGTNSTVDLLVLTSLDQFLFVLKILFTFLQKKLP